MINKFMQILNIAGYKFVPLSALESLRNDLLEQCARLLLKGTVLLSREGINLSLAGTEENVRKLQLTLHQDERFKDMRFHETYSAEQPFKTLKIRLKKEIITLNQPSIDAVSERAPSISPQDFKQWLDEKRDITILDTRNDYEVRFGTFTGAVNLQLNNFGEFPAAAESVDRDKPVVMFCTGGIRCEKAALQMLEKGFKNVFQLDGGILGYFRQVGGAHFDGECFVFDGRIAVDSGLNDTDTVQCQKCQGPACKATVCESCSQSI
jgi:UPF0176 protein